MRKNIYLANFLAQHSLQQASRRVGLLRPKQRPKIEFSHRCLRIVGADSPGKLQYTPRRNARHCDSSPRRSAKHTAQRGRLRRVAACKQPDSQSICDESMRGLRVSDSPYAPPSTPVFDDFVVAGSEAEAIRQHHLRHEIQIKSIGALYYFAGTMFFLAGLSLLFVRSQTQHALLSMELIVGYTVSGPIFLVVGYGFRRLRPWVRIPGSIFSAIGLFAIPVGTVINLWILYLMHCTKGRVVLDSSYQQIVNATPLIRYRRSLSDWIATIIIFGLLIFLVVAMAVALGH